MPFIGSSLQYLRSCRYYFTQRFPLGPKRYRVTSSKTLRTHQRSLQREELGRQPLIIKWDPHWGVPLRGLAVVGVSPRPWL